MSFVSLHAAQYGGAPAAPVAGRPAAQQDQNVAAPRTRDGHPDMSACGAAVAAVERETGRER